MFLEISWISYIEIIKIPTETNNWKPTGKVKKNIHSIAAMTKVFKIVTR